jgi:hypothetical protein
MGSKNKDDGSKKKPGPGQPDTDRRIGRTTVTQKIGRDASTGQFIPVEKAKKRPSTTVIETTKRPAPAKPKKK